MATHNAPIILSFLLAMGLLQARVLDAADATQATAANAQDAAADIEPGAKCLITAPLECEIKEVVEDKILIYVTGNREAEQGIPMLSKVPYTNRLFKNVGVANVETRVVLSIPRDQIKHIEPIADDVSAKKDHVLQAVEHLKAAGLDGMAHAVARQANPDTYYTSPVVKPSECSVLPQTVAVARTGVMESRAYQERRADGHRRQVLVDVKVVEVSLTKLRKCGSDLDVAALNGLLPAKSNEGQRGRDAFAIAILDRDAADTFESIRQLQKRGVVKILAEPTLVTESGQPSLFHSGGSFPILVPQNDGKVAVEWREYGTRVDFVPVVLANGDIRLQVRLRVSEIDDSRGVDTNGIRVPALTERYTESSVAMRAGQTFVIAGLLQEVLVNAGADKGNRNRETEETGLIVLATPSFVEGMPAPPSPASAARSPNSVVKPRLRLR